MDLKDISTNASSHLQEVIGRMLNMTFECSGKDDHGITDLLLPDSQSYLAIHFPIVGDTTGSAFTVFPGESIRHLSECILSQVGKSAAGVEFQELSNILTGSYLTVMSNELNKKIIHSSAKGESLQQLSPENVSDTLTKDMGEGTYTVQTLLENKEKSVTIFFCMTLKEF
jgi:chemotaxis protein CheY-P-specific phosphatase CheC